MICVDSCWTAGKSLAENDFLKITSLQNMIKDSIKNKKCFLVGVFFFFFFGKQIAVLSKI